MIEIAIVGLIIVAIEIYVVWRRWYSELEAANERLLDGIYNVNSKLTAVRQRENRQAAELAELRADLEEADASVRFWKSLHDQANVELRRYKHPLLAVESSAIPEKTATSGDPS